MTIFDKHDVPGKSAPQTLILKISIGVTDTAVQTLILKIVRLTPKITPKSLLMVTDKSYTMIQYKATDSTRENFTVKSRAYKLKFHFVAFVNAYKLPTILYLYKSGSNSGLGLIYYLWSMDQK